MDYLTAMEISLQWNISSRMVAYYCENGRIDGAIKKGMSGLSRLEVKSPLINAIQKKI